MGKKKKSCGGGGGGFEHGGSWRRESTLLPKFLLPFWALKLNLIESQIKVMGHEREIKSL